MSRHNQPLRLGVGDLLLLFVLLVSLVSGLLRFREVRAMTAQADLAAHRMLLLSDPMDASAADCLREGEVLYDAVGDAFGRVVRVERAAAEVELPTADGVVRGEWPTEQRCRLRVELAVLGVMRDGVLLLDGRIPQPIGLWQTLFSDRLMLRGVVIGVSAERS